MFGVVDIRGVSSLYIELALLTVVLGVGSILLGVATSIASSVAKVDPPPKIAAYLVYNKTVVVSWDDRVLELEFVCPNIGVVDSVKIMRGVYVGSNSCDDVLLVVAGYVIKPTRVI
ncbi:MAG: hypothetical protein QW196_01325 [Sulfolobales archaeon]